MSKLIVIDGNSLLFRAYFATAYPGIEIMRSKDGTPTNAIFAFSNMINKIISSLKEEESIIVAFDAGKPTFRHEALETYKANRKPTPPDLVAQFPLARNFLKAMNIFQFEEEGFEGDDIAGTISRMAEKEGYDVVIYTSDRDFIQLVSKKITVNIIKKGLSDILVMTPDSVKETYGFEPLQIIDYKGLRGDSSDNLPGIPGVGDKTAVKLINDYGNFDNILAHADEIGGKVGANIKENAELGTLCRDLAMIKDDVDLPFGVKDTVYPGYDFEKINEFCQKYELKQFMSKISPKWKRVTDSNVVLEIENIASFEGLSFPNKIGIGLDFDESDYSRNEVYGLAINMNSHHYYIKIEDAMNDKALLSALKDENIQKYCLDFKAIKVALNRYNIELNGLAFDLLIAAYLLDSNSKSDYDSVMHFFGVDLPIQEKVSLFDNGNIERAAKMAFFSLMLVEKIKKDLNAINAYELFSELELPLVTTLADMEIEGFPLDANKLDEFGEIYKKNISALEEEIYQLAGTKFNIASPKQVAEILFEKLGLPDYKKGSTSIEVLKDLNKYHPIIGKIIEYRKYFKLFTTYVEGLKPHIFKDGKIHAKFNQALTATGRLSSSEPNLQNISIRDEDGKIIRKAFYYPFDNYEILSLDYSQIELRILAGLSGCKLLQDIFESGEDIHSSTAKRIFKLEGEPSELQRRRAKTVNFGIIYGISDWGLAEQLNISPKEANAFISSFYETFPEVRDFFQKIVLEATENGYVSTMMGRRRYLRELHDSSYQVREFAKRAAMNAPIQGSAADLIKIAMVKVHRAIKEKQLKSKMVLQIHDELIFKVDKDEKDILYSLVKECMEKAIDFPVKFEVEGGFGKTWYDAK